MSEAKKVVPRAHHVGIFVSDLKRAIKWWEDCFGWEKVFQNDFPLPDGGLSRMAWVKGPNCMIELYDYPEKPQQEPGAYWGTLGTKHISLCTSDEEFDALTAHLEKLGVEFTVRVTWPYPITSKPNGNRVVFVNDPDGNSIEVQEDFTPWTYGADYEKYRNNEGAIWE